MLTYSRWHDVLRIGFYPVPVHPEDSCAQAVIRAAAHVEEHLRTSREVRRFIEELPKGPGTSCPDSPLDELVKYVAAQNGSVDKSDPYLNRRFMMEIVQPVFELEREAMHMALRENPDCTPDELTLFEQCTELTRATDHLWSAWFQQVAAPYQALPTEAQEAFKKGAQGQLALYDYTAYLKTGRTITDRRAWATAFPEEIGSLVSILTRMETTPIEGLGPYFAALREAYATTAIDELEEAWRRVDEAWIAIPRTVRFIPVHGFESKYEHPFGVSPEQRVEVRMDGAAELITEVMTASIAEAKRFNLPAALIGLYERKLRLIDIGTSVTALRGGVSMNFRYAGQAGPNRQEVLAHGGRIFVDKASPELKVRLYRERIARWCEPATAQLISPLITASSQLHHTVSHECSHPIGRTPESDLAIGSAGELCEEAKATLFGICSEESADPSASNRLMLTANMIGRLLRFLDRANLSDQTIAPYAREALAAATTLLMRDVIELTPAGLRIEREIAESDAWFALLRTFCHGVITAYRHHDAEMLETLAERYCREDHPKVAALIEYINRPQ